MSKKTIWIINQYASTLDTGIGGRHYYFAKELAKMGHKVYLFSASFHHLLHTPPAIKNTLLTSTEVDGFTYVWIKMPKYNGAHSKKRILNEFLFSWKIRSLNQYITDSPDAIIYSSPALIPFIGVRKLAKKVNAKLILDVRDLWPLTLIEMGGYSESHPVIKYFQHIEKCAYSKSDHIISNWPLAIEHMSEYGANVNKFTWIPNGFSLSEFQNPEPLPPDIVQKFPLNKFIIGYTGTLGKANALETLLDAAQKLQAINSKIHIMIIGNGREKTEIQNKIITNGLKNISLLPAIGKKQIPSALSLFNACYVGFLDIPLYRYGSSLTKLPEYLFSGKPIIYASNSPFQPIKSADAGITIAAQDANAIAQAIMQLYNMSDEQRTLLGNNGKKFALSHYEYGSLTQKLSNILFNEGKS